MGEITQTDFGYTGQRGLPGTGLMDYRARFYEPALGRFHQPDSIVPGAGNPQSLNRYSYVGNSPVNFNDPSGHYVDCSLMDRECQERVRRERNGEIIYDGEKAADWAKHNINNYIGIDNNGNDCTNFASQALNIGGLIADEVWHPQTANSPECASDGNCPWLQTPDLYDYLTTGKGFEAIQYTTEIDYYIGQPPDRGLLSEETGLVDIFKEGVIQPGDLVFFQDGNRSDTWTHAVIVVGFETVKDADGNDYKVPLIVEHDGTGQPLPRRVDSSPNLSIWALAFVSIGR